MNARTILATAAAAGDVAVRTEQVCETCERKNEVIVDLQHLIRELRHDLVIARIEAELSKGTELFAVKKAA